MEITEILPHWKNISWNQLFSNSSPSRKIFGPSDTPTWHVVADFYNFLLSHLSAGSFRTILAEITTLEFFLIFSYFLSNFFQHYLSAGSFRTILAEITTLEFFIFFPIFSVISLIALSVSGESASLHVTVLVITCPTCVTIFLRKFCFTIWDKGGIFFWWFCLWLCLFSLWLDVLVEPAEGWAI